MGPEKCKCHILRLQQAAIWSISSPLSFPRKMLVFMKLSWKTTEEKIRADLSLWMKVSPPGSIPCVPYTSDQNSKWDWAGRFKSCSSFVHRFRFNCHYGRANFIKKQKPLLVFLSSQKCSFDPQRMYSWQSTRGLFSISIIIFVSNLWRLFQDQILPWKTCLKIVHYFKGGRKGYTWNANPLS